MAQPADIPVPVDRLPRILQVNPITTEKKGQVPRRTAVTIRREYYDGVQYGRENEFAAIQFESEDVSFDPQWQRLPEHVRLHNYSDHVQEAVDFLSDQISGQYRIEGDDSVLAWVDEQWKRSGLEHRRQEIPRELLIAGDLFCHVVQAPQSDANKPQSVWQMWEAESVEVDYDPDDWRTITEVRTEELRTVFDPVNEIEVEERHVHRYHLEELPVLLPPALDVSLEEEPLSEPEEAQFVVECVVDLEVDGLLKEQTRLGLPFIPWVHLHGENEALRSNWGRPLVTGQVMETVDRFNAVNQLQFQAVRYNSFGNVVIIGDEVYLREKAASDAGIEGAYVIRKDVADALIVPGATDVQALTLSINVESFESQRDQLVDELFGLFGLERIDADKIRSFGGVSGYALEILNRKTDGTFTRICENVKSGIKGMIEMGLRVDAYVQASQDEFWTVDVNTFWPKREVVIDFGTAYIVDEVAVRDDLVAGMISQQEALRLRGYSEDEITKIMQEKEDEGDNVSDEAALQQGERFSTERA